MSSLLIGARVEVRSRFDHSWAPGFEVADIAQVPAEPMYVIRRLSDGFVLPQAFGGRDVRADWREVEMPWREAAR